MTQANQHKQARRKDSVMVSFLIPVSLFQEVNNALETHNKRTLKHLFSRSEWFLRAVKRDLDHSKRSRARKARRQAAVEAQEEVVNSARIAISDPGWDK